MGGTCHFPPGPQQKPTEQGRAPRLECAGVSVSFGTSQHSLLWWKCPLPNPGPSVNAGDHAELGAELWSVPLPEEVSEAASFVKAALPRSPTGARGVESHANWFSFEQPFEIKGALHEWSISHRPVVVGKLSFLFTLLGAFPLGLTLPPPHGIKMELSVREFHFSHRSWRNDTWSPTGDFGGLEGMLGAQDGFSPPEILSYWDHLSLEW